MSIDVPRPTPEILARYDVPAPRYTSYPPVPAWDDDFPGYPAAIERAASSEAPLSLYVHVPFCWSLCHYCGCNVVVSKNQDRADSYLDLLAKEIALVGERLAPRRAVQQLHFGGGTPTFLRESQMVRLFEMLGTHFDLLPDAEISVEVHPGVTTLEQLKQLRALGCNRISLGIQDTDQQVLSAIGRDQSLVDSCAALDAARGLGFESVNFDLIYGLPYQDTRTWGRTLDTVLGMRPDRVAAYAFAFVPNLRPNQRRLDAEAMLNGAAKLDLFRQAWHAFESAGYTFLGLDHFAAPGDELAEAAKDGRLWRNFQGYTVRHAPETVALGVTGISDIGGAYAQNVRTLPKYAEALNEGRLPTVKGMLRTADDDARRDLIARLMCHLKLDLDEAYDAELKALQPMVADGLVELDGRHLTVTRLGRLFLRNIAQVFDARSSKAQVAKMAQAV